MSVRQQNPSESAGVIQIERHGEIAIIMPTSDVETMQWEHIEQAAEIVLAPLKREPAASVTVGFSNVPY